MYEIKKNDLFVSDIASYLGVEYVGDDLEIKRFVSCTDLTKNCFTYVTDGCTVPDRSFECLVLCSQDFKIVNQDITYIRCENPELSFYNVVNEFYVEPENYTIASSAVISEGVTLGVNINIGSNTYIGRDVQVGDNTYIGNNVVIKGIVSIGRNCFIKDGSVIGSEGFDFIKDTNKLIHVPQVGKIIIEDNVWIGSNSVIERATLDITYIKSGVKIDDLVQVGNSCIIDSNTQVVSGSVLGARVKVGQNCFLGMNVAVKENINIGSNVIVGSGASVINNLEDDTTYVGVPAKRIEKREI